MMSSNPTPIKAPNPASLSSSSSFAIDSIDELSAETIAVDLALEAILDGQGPPLEQPTTEESSAKPKLRLNSSAWRNAVAKIGRTGHVRIYDIAFKRHADIATGFCVELDSYFKTLSNGRTFAPWGERLCEIIKLVILHLSNDVKGSDGLDANGKQVSIKSLTKAGGIKVQLSCFTGKGRVCTHPNLVFSIESSDFHVCVDITSPKTIRVTCMPKELLLKWVDEGLLTASGIGTSEELLALIEHTADTHFYEELDLDDLRPGLAERNRDAYLKWLAAQANHAKPFQHDHFNTTAASKETGLAQAARDTREALSHHGIQGLAKN